MKKMIDNYKATANGRTLKLPRKIYIEETNDNIEMLGRSSIAVINEWKADNKKLKAIKKFVKDMKKKYCSGLHIGSKSDCDEILKIIDEK